MAPRSIDNIADDWLVLRSQDGSAAALELLLRRWQKRLWIHARRLIDDASGADDVLQEAMLGIARGIRGLDDPARFQAWAYRIVANKATDAVRKLQRRRAAFRAYAADGQAEAIESPDASAADRLTATMLAMKQLTASDRALLSLIYLEEFSVREASEALGIPEGTVKSRLFYARQRLRAAVAPDCGDIGGSGGSDGNASTKL